jgi:hypothetical protein
VRSSTHTPVEVVERRVENGIVQPINYNSVSNNFRQRRSNKLDSRRGPSSKRSYLKGRRTNDTNALRESLPEQVDEDGNAYFSIYGRG